MKNATLIRLSLIAAIGAWIGFGLIVISIVEFSGDMGLETYLQQLLEQRPWFWLLLIIPTLAIILTVFSFRNVDQVSNRGEYFSALFNASPVAIVTLDLNHKIIAANPSFESLFGYSEGAIRGQPLDPLITSGNTSTEAQDLTHGVISGQSISAKGLRSRKDGSLVEVEIFGVPVMVNDEQVGALGLYHDVSRAEKARRELRASEEKYRDIYENTIDFLYTHDLEGNITGANPAFVKSSGYDLDQLASMTIEDLMPLEHKRFFAYYMAKVKKKGKSEGMLHIKTKAGKALVVEYKNSLIEDADGPMGVRGSAHDVSSRMRLEQQLKDSMGELDKLARTDPLTGLLNRRGIYEQLEVERQRAERLEVPLSVAMIDLDGLKEINDTYGHNIGDEALKTVANSVLKCIRSYDRVGRYGGDEFVIVFPGANLKQSAKVCSRILETVRATQSSQPGLSYSASIGFTSFEREISEAEGDLGVEEVLANADDALYKAKDAGGGQVVYYDPRQKELGDPLT